MSCFRDEPGVFSALGYHALYWAMPNRSSKKRPRDVNQLAHEIVEAATQGEEDGAVVPLEEGAPQPREKNPAAVELGRLGGKKGGRARAAKLTPEERSRIAREAAQKRWRDREKLPSVNE